MLRQSQFLEADVSLAGLDRVVQQRDIQDVADVLQAIDQERIGAGWFQATSWMVTGQDDGIGSGLKSDREHHSRIKRGIHLSSLDDGNLPHTQHLKQLLGDRKGIGGHLLNH